MIAAGGVQIPLVFLKVDDTTSRGRLDNPREGSSGLGCNLGKVEFQGLFFSHSEKVIAHINLETAMLQKRVRTTP